MGSSTLAESVISLARDGQALLLQTSPIAGLPYMDLIGLPRLMAIMNMIFRNVNTPGKRPAFATEVFVVCTLVFGGEAIAALLIPGAPVPSFIASPYPVVLFATFHWIVTSFSSHIPARFPLWVELLAAPFDALGRAIVVCSFVTEGLLAKPEFAGNWYMIVVATWLIMTSGSVVVNTFGMFQAEWTAQTPAELKAYGWLIQDLWIPAVFTPLYLHLTRPCDLSSTRLAPYLPVLSPFLPLGVAEGIHTPWAQEDARAFCGALITVLFVARAMWNYRDEIWESVPPAKPKTAVQGTKTKLKSQ